ncbi:hypothetical protein [Nodosilinea sp. P-1105]|uniref:hypothetical protein n=1 Tax=Nodosilinea sp. P-1105 TaxID=2546229 RepID=UPI00146F73D3|nr:hypothetical protein [Nodosilinea sp. P-1105]NMF84383.1 hypothetical protein [Nodosilinea sp. P-1105]
MKLWFVCFCLLFFTVEGLQWLGQVHWFSGVDLGIPWAIAGGVGLAIASNRAYWKTLNLPTPPPTSPQPDVPTPGPPAAPSPPQTTQPSSISFEIKKPQR